MKFFSVVLVLFSGIHAAFYTEAVQNTARVMNPSQYRKTATELFEILNRGRFNPPSAQGLHEIVTKELGDDYIFIVPLLTKLWNSESNLDAIFDKVSTAKKQWFKGMYWMKGFVNQLDLVRIAVYDHMTAMQKLNAAKEKMSPETVNKLIAALKATNNNVAEAQATQIQQLFLDGQNIKSIQTGSIEELIAELRVQADKVTDLKLKASMENLAELARLANEKVITDAEKMKLMDAVLEPLFDLTRKKGLYTHSIESYEDFINEYALAEKKTLEDYMAFNQIYNENNGKIDDDNVKIAMDRAHYFINAIIDEQKRKDTAQELVLDMVNTHWQKFEFEVDRNVSWRAFVIMWVTLASYYVWYDITNSKK